MDHSRLLIPILVLGAVGCATAQMTWQLAETTGPALRKSSVAVFDAHRGHGVLFGGASTGTNSQTVGLSDTWTWDGHWNLKSPLHIPPARMLHCMAFDRTRGVVVMTMGITRQNYGTTLSDTWTWNGVDWTPMNPTTVPPGRSAAAMAYDEALQVCILFGGGDGAINLFDTWEWNGVDWVQRNPTHYPTRLGLRMAYDAGRARTMILAATTSGYTQIQEQWEYVGGDWVQMPNPVMPARYAETMFYDRGRQRMVVFSGANGWGLGSDTWEYDGTSWVQVNVPSPPLPRAGSGNFYDEWRGNGVIYGGTGDIYWPSQSDTWIYTSPSPATVVSYAPGCPGPAGVPWVSVTRRPILGDTYEIHVENLDSQALTFLMTGWSMTSIHLGNIHPAGAGCVLSATPDYQTALIGTNAYTLAVPNDPVFLGVALHNQAVQLGITGVDISSISVSNAVRMVMGNP